MLKLPSSSPSGGWLLVGGGGDVHSTRPHPGILSRCPGKSVTRFQVFRLELMTSPPNPPSSCLFLPGAEEHQRKTQPAFTPYQDTRVTCLVGLFRECVPRVRAISTSSFSPRERKRRDDAYDIWIEGCGGKRRGEAEANMSKT